MPQITGGNEKEMTGKRTGGITIRRGGRARYRSERPRERASGLRMVAVMALLSGCVADASVQRPGVASAPPPAVASTPAMSAFPRAEARPQPVPAGLQSAITDLGRHFDGTVGISVRRVGATWEASWNSRQLMPQQSVSKLWVAMTTLDALDRGKLTLATPVTITARDLTLFHQPLAYMLKSGSYTTQVRDLLTRAMQQSDNTANDSLLRTVGGPVAVRSFLARRYIPDIRFGPGERLLQSKTAGLEWNQSMSVGRNFYTARANLPRSVREKALDSYLSNPPDGAAAGGITLALSKLKAGEMLSPASTQFLLSTMAGAKTGPQRIKGGVSGGWHYAHKTGTGQELGARSTGYNDVGVLTAPDGTSYAVAVLIASTTQPIPVRWQLMQGVAKAVIANHQP